MLRDLHALIVMVAHSQTACTALTQAARALRDSDLSAACSLAGRQIRRQHAWLQTQILHRSAHVLTVHS